MYVWVLGLGLSLDGDWVRLPNYPQGLFKGHLENFNLSASLSNLLWKCRCKQLRLNDLVLLICASALPLFWYDMPCTKKILNLIFFVFYQVLDPQWPKERSQPCFLQFLATYLNSRRHSRPVSVTIAITITIFSQNDGVSRWGLMSCTFLPKLMKIRWEAVDW